MSNFSPTEAVFAGFRFARARPAALLIWAAYYLVVLAVALFALFDLAGDKMLQLMALQKAGAADPGPMLAIMDDISPALGFAALLMMVFGAVMRAAVLRAYLEPGKIHPWAGLRFRDVLELQDVGVAKFANDDGFHGSAGDEITIKPGQGLALDIPLFVGTSPWLVGSICLARSARLHLIDSSVVAA